MTTYTLTAEQRETLMNTADSAYCYELLKSLQPNTQETQAQRIEELEAKLRIAQMSTVEKCAEIYMLRQKQQPKPLTDEQIDEIWLAVSEAYDETGLGYESHNFARAIEAAHGIKPS